MGECVLGGGSVEGRQVIRNRAGGAHPGGTQI